MHSRIRWIVAAVIPLTLVALGYGLAGAATSTTTMAGGSSLTLQCSGSALKWTQTNTTGGVASCVASTATVSPSTTTAPTTGSTPSAACHIANPAFCETFDQPTTANPASNSRAGQLNGRLWGTSMETAAPADPLAQTTAPCTGASVVYPANMQICDGQLRETTNDAGTVTSLAMYPRQPFDFAGRTGTITFDVSNNTQGNHAAWPELWISDQPVPDPFTHEASWQSLPKNGFGIRFAGCTDSSGNANTCSLGSNGVGVDSAVTVSNYVGNDSFTGGGLKVYGYGSVLKSSGPGQMNHYQVEVSTSEISVYGTNAFAGTWNPTTDPLVLLAKIPVKLTFTRGLVWLEDVHYNGNKFGSQRTNTFAWDNLGFDGPVVPRDLGFDVPANSIADTNVAASGLTGVDSAYQALPNGSVSVQVPGVTAANISAASAALLEANFYALGSNETSFTVAVNGHTVSVPWPYPDSTVDSPRTLAIPVPLSDLVAGTNRVSFYTGAPALSVSNIDLILAGAGGTP